MAAASSLGIDGLGRDKTVKELEAGNVIGMDVRAKAAITCTPILRTAH